MSSRDVDIQLQFSGGCETVNRDMVLGVADVGSLFMEVIYMKYLSGELSGYVYDRMSAIFGLMKAGF